MKAEKYTQNRGPERLQSFGMVAKFAIGLLVEKNYVNLKSRKATVFEDGGRKKSLENMILTKDDVIWKRKKNLHEIEAAWWLVWTLNKSQ